MKFIIIKSELVDADTITAPILRLETISNSNLPWPKIIKMDIEGLEYSSIEDLGSSNIWPAILTVEFHYGKYEGITADDTMHSVMLLIKAGYAIFYFSDSV